MKGATAFISFYESIPYISYQKSVSVFYFIVMQSAHVYSMK